jgi:hypothetical protein
MAGFGCPPRARPRLLAAPPVRVRANLDAVDHLPLLHVVHHTEPSRIVASTLKVAIEAEIVDQVETDRPCRGRVESGPRGV